MSGIGPLGPLGRAAAARGARRIGGFALPASAEPGGAAALGGTLGVTATALTALQEDPRAIAERRDAAARRRGDALLAELAGLQRDLLDGDVPRARLQRLAALATGEDGADPGLREAVRAVALRAAIELARRGF